MKHWLKPPTEGVFDGNLAPKMPRRKQEAPKRAAGKRSDQIVRKKRLCCVFAAAARRTSSHGISVSSDWTCSVTPLRPGTDVYLWERERPAERGVDISAPETHETFPSYCSPNFQLGSCRRSNSHLNGINRSDWHPPTPQDWMAFFFGRWWQLEACREGERGALRAFDLRA